MRATVKVASRAAVQVEVYLTTEAKAFCQPLSNSWRFSEDICGKNS
mgnify:CR=1 FL=1